MKQSYVSRQPVAEFMLQRLVALQDDKPDSGLIVTILCDLEWQSFHR